MKEEVVEIIESESVPWEFGNMVSFMEDLFHYALSVGDRDTCFTLNLRQEPPDLLRRHVDSICRILVERFLDVRRRIRLRDLESPREAHTCGERGTGRGRRRIINGSGDLRRWRWRWRWSAVKAGPEI
ncbi:unnamed protein product [Camellia sinensis]